MMVSTRGRYALRVIIDMAEHMSAGYIPMKEIAGRQDISKKYLEQIMPVLVKNGLCEGVHGAKGGYKLKKAPCDCTVGEILRLTEGCLAPVACLSDGNEICKKHEECRTFAMWEAFDKITNEYFDGITIKDLMRTDRKDKENEITDGKTEKK